MASVGGIIYGFIFAVVAIICVEMFVGSLQSHYGSNIMAGNLSTNSTFAKSVAILYSNNSDYNNSAFYGNVSQMANMNAQGSSSSTNSTDRNIAAMTQAFVFMVLPGSQWVWNTLQLLLTLLFAPIALIADLANALSVGGFPAGWLLIVIGAIYTIYIILEALGAHEKYKMQ
jgi:hypothetical protein